MKAGNSATIAGKPTQLIKTIPDFQSTYLNFVYKSGSLYKKC